MALSVAERKHRLPHGAIKEIAAEEGVTGTYVGRVLIGEAFPKSDAAQKRTRRIQVAIARKLHMRVDDVFPLEAEPNEAQVA